MAHPRDLDTVEQDSAAIDRSWRSGVHHLMDEDLPSLNEVRKVPPLSRRYPDLECRLPYLDRYGRLHLVALSKHIDMMCK